MISHSLISKKLPQKYQSADKKSIYNVIMKYDLSDGLRKSLDLYAILSNKEEIRPMSQGRKETFAIWISHCSKPIRSGDKI